MARDRMSVLGNQFHSSSSPKLQLPGKMRGISYWYSGHSGCVAGTCFDDLWCPCQENINTLHDIWTPVTKQAMNKYEQVRNGKVCRFLADLLVWLRRLSHVRALPPPLGSRVCSRGPSGSWPSAAHHGLASVHRASASAGSVAKAPAPSPCASPWKRTLRENTQNVD